jgi:predicted nucleotidyltransferase
MPKIFNLKITVADPFVLKHAKPKIVYNTRRLREEFANQFLSNTAKQVSGESDIISALMNEHLLNKDYRDMIECLLKAGVDFMLVGGYAVALHGWPRTTFDIDFWIMANPENAKAVVQAIRAFGAPLMNLTEADFHKPGMVFQIGAAPQRIDIISAIDGLDYSEAVGRAVRMNVDGLAIKVISLDDLIVNKRASGRPKDIADALALEKLKARSGNG